MRGGSRPGSQLYHMAHEKVLGYQRMVTLLRSPAKPEPEAVAQAFGVVGETAATPPAMWGVLVTGRKSLNAAPYQATYAGRLRQVVPGVAEEVDVYRMAVELLGVIREMNREMEVPMEINLRLDLSGQTA